MTSRWLLFMVCWGVGTSLLAQSVELFSANFEQDRTLQGWVSSIDTGETPPDTAFGVAASEDVAGKINHFYRGLNNTFGVSATLDRPYQVDKNTATIEIRARVRCNGEANPVSLDLSSRESPTFPFPFSAGKGSGFGVAGYQHANAVNRLYVYRDTKTPTGYGEKRALVANARDWHTWRLRYDHAAGTLSLYVNSATEPALVQKEVNLDAVEFRSLWFMGSGSGADYDDIQVLVTTGNTPNVGK